MAERYSRLYSLPEDLYTPGAPLVIAAGALLLDNQTGRMLAQLKLRSISDGTIIAASVLVIGLGAGGEELCRAQHVYANLSAGRDASFGAREAVRLPESGVRSFSVYLLTVSFGDGTEYTGHGEALKALPAQANLNKRLFDAELIRQYKLETSSMSRFVPLEFQDLWLCTCGEINHKGESCHRCAQSFEHCRASLNVDRLRESKSLRLSAAAARAAIEEKKKQERGRIIKRVLYLLLPLALIAAVTVGAYLFSSRRAAVYEEAMRYYDAGEYAEAALRFGQISRFGGYKDAKDLAAKAKKADAEIASYARAGKLLENGRWDDAHAAYLELGDYLDSAQLAQEALYQKGLALIEEGRYVEAREQFHALAFYKDAPDITASFRERCLSEEISFNQECGGPLTTSYSYDNFGRVAQKTEQFSAYPGMSDRVSTYQYAEDGSYTVTEGQVEKRYDAEGSLIGQGNVRAFEYEYKYYEDGSVQFCISYDAQTHAYRGATAYDEHGSVSATQDAEGAIISMINEYDGDRLTKQERYNEAGTMLSRTTFDYDENGMCKRATFVTPGAAATVTVLYTNGPVYAPWAER